MHLKNKRTNIIKYSNDLVDNDGTISINTNDESLFSGDSVDDTYEIYDSYGNSIGTYEIDKGNISSKDRISSLFRLKKV